MGSVDRDGKGEGGFEKSERERLAKGRTRGCCLSLTQCLDR